MHDLIPLVHTAMVQRPAHLGADVAHQRASESDIDHLMSAADRQERFGLAEDFVDQDQLA